MKTQEILNKEVLSEQELRLIVRRANAGEQMNQYEWRDFYLLTPEQNNKGYKWLMNLWKTPKGAERKNNPFGLREQDALENFKYFTFDGLYDAGTYGRSWYTPIYTVMTREGIGFQYIVRAGGIEIIG